MAKLKKIILSDIMSTDDRNAGGKARNDVRDILKSDGFCEWTVFNRNLPGIIRAIQGVLSIKILTKRADADSCVVMQYPYNIKLTQLFIKELNRLQNKGGHIVLLIHDIYYLRDDQKYDKDQLKQMEIDIFNKANNLIVHNDKMLNKLASDGVKTPMTSLGIFDYLADKNHRMQKDGDEISVVYAGSLNKDKSTFLYKWVPSDDISVLLYGVSDDTLPTVYVYKGSAKPEELVSKLDADYGLVWDGNSIDGCDGNFGDYLKYNNPHKASLYLAAGIPLIVWKESAIADFVKDNGVGVCISSLNDISRLPRCTSDEYKYMSDNAKRISERIRTGSYLKKAICEVIK